MRWQDGMWEPRGEHIKQIVNQTNIWYNVDIWYQIVAHQIFYINIWRAIICFNFINVSIKVFSDNSYYVI